MLTLKRKREDCCREATKCPSGTDCKEEKGKVKWPRREKASSTRLSFEQVDDILRLFRIPKDLVNEIYKFYNPFLGEVFPVCMQLITRTVKDYTQIEGPGYYYYHHRPRLTPVKGFRVVGWKWTVCEFTVDQELQKLKQVLDYFLTQVFHDLILDPKSPNRIQPILSHDVAYLVFDPTIATYTDPTHPLYCTYTHPTQRRKDIDDYNMRRLQKSWQHKPLEHMRQRTKPGDMLVTNDFMRCHVPSQFYVSR